MNKILLKQIISIAAVYFAVAETSIVLSTNNISTAIVWPAAGIAFASILFFGTKIWPAIAIGSLLANTHYLMARDPSFLALLGANIGIAIGNIAGPLMGMYFIKRMTCVELKFIKQKDILVFTLLGVIPAAAITSFFGILSMYGAMLGKGSRFLTDWQQWGVSDFVGVLIIAPAMLLWLQNPSVKFHSRKSAEAGLVTLCIIIVAFSLFTPVNDYMNHSLVRPFLLILPLIWGAIRFSPRAVATWNVLAFVILWLGTSYGYGHYNREMLPQPMVPVQLFLGTMGFTILLLNTVIQELKQARLVLLDLNINLEKRVLDRTRNLKESEQRLRKAKKKAEEATKVKDKFIALVSHDLKGPISGIAVIAERIYDPNIKINNKEIKKFARLINSSAENLTEMIDQLLDISRLKTGKIKPLKKLVNVCDLAAEKIESISFIANNKNIIITNKLPGDMLVTADPALLGQVLQNVLSNAVKFCREKDTITLFCPDANSATIAVKDTGTGIDESILPNLFEHEVKTSTTGTDDEKGSGFGLPFCMDILEAHGGSIDVDSIKGEGCTFYIRLQEKVRQ